MRFNTVRIVGVSRLHDEAGELGGTYEVRWSSDKPFLEGRILAELPEQAWPRIEADVKEQWGMLPPPDPMMEFSGKERVIDAQGKLVVLGKEEFPSLTAAEREMAYRQRLG